MIKALIFILSITLAYPQAIYRMRMNIRSIEHGNITTCSNKLVFWGIKEDTVCFSFDSRSLCYYTLTKKAKIESLKIDRIKSYLINRSRRGDKYYLLQDHRNEVYLIRIISDGTVLIFITNIVHGFPSYVLGFNCSECLN